MTAGFQSHLYRAAVIFAVAFSFLHLVSLPIVISYDGLGYLDLADVLFSNRFPRDWLDIRTPLFPLCLKIAFWLFGRQPLAAILVSTSLGTGGILLLGSLFRRLLGDAAAAGCIVLLSLYPVFVAYQHYVLTEVGSFFFLAVAVCLLFWDAGTTYRTWARAAGLIATISIGYYWRQNILPVAGIVSLLHCWSAVSARVPPEAAEKSARRKWLGPGNAAIFCQAVLIVAVPYCLSKVWDKCIPREVVTNPKDVARQGMTNVALQQGMFRQALLPPDHPLVGAFGDEYRKAIQDSVFEGNFYSGLRADLEGVLADKIFAAPPAVSMRRLYFDLIRQYPRRYVSGVGRTLMLFMGFKALQNETLISREIVLSPTMLGAKIADGPPALTASVKADFDQRTKTSVALWTLRAVSPIYEFLLIAANITTLLGLLAGLALRNYRLVVLCGIPVMYLIPYALFLACLDRFAVPVYPITLANLVTVPLLLKAGGLKIRNRRSTVAG